MASILLHGSDMDLQMHAGYHDIETAHVYIMVGRTCPPRCPSQGPPVSCLFGEIGSGAHPIHLHLKRNHRAQCPPPPSAPFEVASFEVASFEVASFEVASFEAASSEAAFFEAVFLGLWSTRWLPSGLLLSRKLRAGVVFQQASNHRAPPLGST